ncbi:MAG: di-heme-cytochrome C peroxidase [Hyphomicrobiales bacterium]|nr:di-heme-cytochrome C peroxidase [Hyphomicrobiales bacterium]
MFERRKGRVSYPFFAISLSVLGLTVGAVRLSAQETYGSSYSYDNTILLDQGWSDEDRLRYYFNTQGSAALSYNLFMNLEEAKSDNLFRADENLARFGLVPYPADPTYNPDGLPIGITRTVVPDGRWKGEWLGIGCAACHNGRLQYNGQQISISGGSAGWFDIYTLLAELNGALAATSANPDKFNRLADKMALDHDELRTQLDADVEAIDNYVNVVSVTPAVPGPGRMDALGLIHNQVNVRWLGVPENWQAPLAPTKPSFVWNVPQAAWAQWSGVLSDPLNRNVGEVMGVFARLDISSPSVEEGLFESTVDIPKLIESEDLLRRLAPPRWPEEVLGTIDKARTARGAELFSENCGTCHSSWPHRWSEPRKLGKRFIENAIVAGDVIGTDPNQFRSTQFEFLPTVKSGPIAPNLAPPDTGAVVLSPATMFRSTLQPGIMNRLMVKTNLSDEELLSAHGFGPIAPEEPLPIPVLGGYKANPVEGMWASPPYLHNGSVPSLYDLLTPAADRPKTFYVGREYDPLKVGIDVSGNSGTFLFDTAQVGNSNAGHSFEDRPLGNGVIGRLLTEDERWALIEFVKSVPSESAQISPFGGPPNPKRAWLDETFYHVRNPGTYNGAPDLQ